MSCLDEFDLMSILELEADPTDRSLDQFIDAVRMRYRLRNIAYICPSFHGRGFDDPVMAVTYSDAWVEHYKAERYMAVDPVIRMGARSVLPFDWRGLPRMEKKVKRLFGEAREAGVGHNGLTIPVRGPVNGLWALLVATSDETDSHWAARRIDLMRDLVHIAYYVHQRAYDLHSNEEYVVDLNQLSGREIEALQWSAEGARLATTAMNMRISVETVRAHLESARFKLQALNRAHAVTKALRAGLIR